MEKRQSIDFLQKCIDSLEYVTKEEIIEMRRLYEAERTNESTDDFEVILPDHNTLMEVEPLNESEKELNVEKKTDEYPALYMSVFTYARK